MKRIPIFLVILTLLYGCERFLDQYDNISGRWITVVFCDSCNIFEFNDDNQLIIRNINDGNIIEASYKFMNPDLIFIETPTESKEYPIYFHTSDSIEISEFKITDMYFHERKTLLKRIRQ